MQYKLRVRGQGTGQEYGEVIGVLTNERKYDIMCSANKTVQNKCAERWRKGEDYDWK